MKSDRSRRIAQEKEKDRRASAILGTRAGRVFLLALIIITSLIFGREFISYLRNRAQLAALQADAESMKAGLDKTREENENLENDEKTIELEIREKLHKTRDDEILIVPPTDQDLQ